MTRAAQIVKALVENDLVDPKDFILSRERPKSIDIIGKLWWRRGYGGTYHTAHIYVDGQKVHVTPEMGGGGNQYLEAATQWLEDEGYIPTRPSRREPGWAWIRDTLNIPLNYYSEDVKRRRDLF